MVAIQIMTMLASLVVLASTLSKIHSMNANTDNRIRVAFVLICIGSFYELLLITCAKYEPSPVEFLMMIGYSTLLLSCRRDRRRVFARRSKHETSCN